MLHKTSFRVLNKRKSFNPIMRLSKLSCRWVGDVFYFDANWIKGSELTIWLSRSFSLFCRPIIDGWFLSCGQIKLKYILSFLHTTESTTIIQFVHIITFVRFRVHFMDFSSSSTDDNNISWTIFCCYKYTSVCECIKGRKIYFPLFSPRPRNICRDLSISISFTPYLCSFLHMRVVGGFRSWLRH